MTRLFLMSAVFWLAFSASLPAHAGPRPPVVVIAFDEFPVDSLLRPDGRIDAARYPAFGRLARAATWFPNAFAVHDHTTHALPAILDGRHPRRGARPDYTEHPENLFTLLAGHGYRVTASEPVTDLCPPRICPGSTGPDPFWLSARAALFRTMLQAIRPTRRPRLVFHHQVFPHQPWEFLPSGRRYKGDSNPFDGGLSSFRGFHDAFLTHQNQQRFLLQVGFVDRELGLLLDRLERTGLFDRALLVVTADHGISFDIGVTERRAVSPGKIAEVAPVPLFVKAPHQDRSRVRPAYVHTIDVLPTIFDVLGLRIPAAVDGRSAFARRGAHTSATPDVRHQALDRSGSPSAGARQGGEPQEQARLFGVGRQSLFEFGPLRGLLGRRVETFRRGASVMTVDGLDTARTFRPASGHAPIWFTGLISGGRPGSTHRLALAVNQSIAAVGRSFHLRDAPGERFSLLIPEAALRPGPNHAALYQVHRRTLQHLRKTRRSRRQVSRCRSFAGDQNPDAAYHGSRERLRLLRLRDPDHRRPVRLLAVAQPVDADRRARALVLGRIAVVGEVEAERDRVGALVVRAELARQLGLAVEPRVVGAGVRIARTRAPARARC